QRASLSAVTSPYLHLPGITNASGGFNADGFVTQTQNTYLAVRAVDPATYAQTASWTTQDSSQPLDSLMALLVQQRTPAFQDDKAPAIIDSSAANNQELQVGATFSVQWKGCPDSAMGSTSATLP